MYRKNFIAASVGCAVLAMLAASPAFGQALKGTILGTVSDPSHAVMPGVEVNVTEVNTNFRRAVTTNEFGFYAFANLDPGTYRIDIQHTGFGKMSRSGIVL